MLGRTAAFVVVAALSGCAVSLEEPAAADIRCASDAECPTDRHCNLRLGQCLRAQDEDITPPIILTARVEPTVLNAGAVATITFETDEPLSIAPAVAFDTAVGPLQLTPTSTLDDDARRFSFTYTATGSETEGVVQLSTELTDLDGNAGQLVLPATLGFDFTGPRALSAIAIALDTIVVTFDEPLAIDAAQDLSHYTLSDGLIPDRAIAGADGSQVTVITSNYSTNITYHVTVSGVHDIAGNAQQNDPTTLDFVGFGTQPDDNPPLPLVPLDGAGVAGVDVEFAWTSRAQASRYSVSIAKDVNFNQPVDGSPFIAHAATRTTVHLPAGGTYYWKVTADVTNPAKSLTVRTLHVLTDAVYVYCNGACSSAATGGTVETPLQAIGPAIELASKLGIRAVKVARRNSGAYNEALNVAPGVSLLGGYDATFADATRNLAAPTLITTAEPVAMAITGISDAAKALIIEGVSVTSTNASTAFTLQVSGCNENLRILDSHFASGPTVDIARAGYFVSNGGVDIERVSFSGGTGIESYGLVLLGSNPVLVDVQATGGKSTAAQIYSTQSIGMVVGSGSAPAVTRGVFSAADKTQYDALGLRFMRTGGGTFDSVQIAGAEMRAGGLPSFTNCHFTGDLTSLFGDGGASTTIVDTCLFDGGAYLASDANGAPAIRNSTINGVLALSAGGQTITATQNRISTTFPAAVANVNFEAGVGLTGPVLFVGNVVTTTDATGTDRAAAVRCLGCSGIIAANTLISGGSSTQVTAGFDMQDYSVFQPSPHLINNIIGTRDGSQRFGIHYDPGNVIAELRNNFIFHATPNTGSPMIRPGVSYQPTTTAIDGLLSATITPSGNVSLGTDSYSGGRSLAQIFVDPSGASGTAADDFALLPGNPAVGAGRNLFGNPTYGSLTIGLDGAALTSCGAAPCDAATPAWNIGARP